MRGLTFRPLHRHGKKTMIFAISGLIAVGLIGGGAYAALGGSILQSSSSNIDLQNGLVGHWKLDGNAKDATPNANNGTIAGATVTNDRKG
ncbi:MAG: hypothetical protein JWR59_2497, partial [Brevundimonas sp.]|nr:hypothetical protein [Brevundimonas sp.]